MPRVTRTLRRLARPALAVVLVLAQAVAAFGFPVARSKSRVKACGCTVVCGTTPDCCCTTPPPPPPPAAAPVCPRCVAETEPEPPACPKCRAKEAPKPACSHCPASTTPATTQPADGVTWVSAWKARQCRGEGPGGVMIESPAVPPTAPVVVHGFPVPSPFAPPVDVGVPHFATDPSDPPPRG